MLGTLINSCSIVVGALVGLRLKKGLSGSQIEAVRAIVGLISVLIGIGMFSNGTSVLAVLLSLVMGTIVGERVDIDGKLVTLGGKLKPGREDETSIAAAFYASTLLFGVGPMAMLGPIHEAISGDMSILLMKSLIDGISSVVMSASLGAGVLFSSLSILVYQGLFYVVGLLIGQLLPSVVVTAITSTGGVLILAIGLNLLNVTKLRVGNMLPSLLAAGIISLFVAF